MDKIHEEIRVKIEELRKRIKKLSDDKEYYAVQHQQLYILKTNEGDDDAILKQKELVAGLKTPEELDIEIESIQGEITKIYAGYWSKDFIDEPLRLNTTKTYKNKYSELRQLANGRWYLYEGSDLATPGVEIILNENGIPIQIVRIIRNSETEGYVTKHIQEILLDQPEPKKDTPPKTPFIYLPEVRPLSQEEKNKILYGGPVSQATAEQVKNIKETLSLTKKVRNVLGID